MRNQNYTTPAATLPPSSDHSHRVPILIGVSLAFAMAALLLYSHLAVTAAHAGSPSTSALFGPTVSNPLTPPHPAPPGMAWIPGGEFSMGANDPPDMNAVGMNATKDARPIHQDR